MVTHFLFHGYEIAARARRRRGGAAVHADLERSSARRSRRCRRRGAPRRRCSATGCTSSIAADVPQLPALLQAHPPARRAAEHLHAQPLRAPDGPAEAEPRGREPVGRRQVRAVLVEEPARHLRVHRVRALHELLPRVQHRQEPVADAAHPRHPLRDARPRRRCATRSRELEERDRGPRGVRARRTASTTRIRTPISCSRASSSRRRRPSSRRCRS